MKLAGWLTLVYALIVFLGGIFGYVKAESVPSLVMGVIFAAVLGISAFMIFNKKALGFYTGVGSSLFLFLFFLWRFAMTFKVMPAGIMCILSLAILVILVSRRATLMNT
ncbi:MAG: TMEM14 family protein [Parachlamydiaceae bacterium]